MTDITDLSDEQKSVLLARAMGWMVFERGRWVWTAQFADKNKRNLYDPANMALAWRVLNWAHQNLYTQQWLEFNRWWKFYAVEAATGYDMWGEDNAQRLWLDKILELCIAAGLVTLPD